MIIRSISGPDIDATMTNAMQATLDALIGEGHLSKEVADKFLETHVCLMVNSDGVWFRIKKFLNWKGDENDFRAVVFKVVEKP